MREDSREDPAASGGLGAHSRAAGLVQGRGPQALGAEGSCRSKEGAALRQCSTRRLIKTEVWTPGARPNFGTRRVTYKETYTHK